MCGDLNSQTDSAVYQFLADGHFSETHPELEGIDWSILPDTKRMTHGLSLVSAMTSNGQDEPLFTNYTGTFKGTLDYIWFAPSEFRVEALLSLPSEEELLKR